MWTLMGLLNPNFLNKMQNIHLHLTALYKPHWNHQGALPFLSSAFGENPRFRRQTFPTTQRTDLRSYCHPQSHRLKVLTVFLCSHAGFTSPGPTSLVLKTYYNCLTLLASYSQQPDKELSLPHPRLSSFTTSGPPASWSLISFG